MMFPQSLARLRTLCLVALLGACSDDSTEEPGPVDAAVDVGGFVVVDAAPRDATLDAAPTVDAELVDATIDLAPHDDDAGMCIKTNDNALSFAGSQYVAVADSSSVHFTDLTVEAWVNFSDYAGATGGIYNTIVAKPYADTGTADSFAVWYESGGLRAGVNPHDVATSIGGAWTPDLGVWHHIAFSYDHTTLSQRLYLDGALFASGTMSTPAIYDAHPFLIGIDINGTELAGGFYGFIDEVRIWTSVRSPDDIVADLHSCMPGSFDGLGAYFGFDEGDGQLAHDLSTNDNSGSLGASTSVGADDPTWVGSTVPFR